MSATVLPAAAAAAPARPRRRRPSRAWVLLAPCLALSVLILGYPFWQIILLSLSDVSRFGLVRGFAGAANFAAVGGDAIFQAALWRTLLWTAGVVGGTVLLSVPVVLVLRQDFHGRGLARTLVMLPWAVSLAMAAIAWMWSFNADYGMANVVLRQLGLVGTSVQWLARPETAFPVEIAVGILVSIPFTATILLGGLSSIPDDIYEAAAIDGAPPGRAFLHITLPLLAPFINIVVVLNVIHVFNSFPIIWVMTGGGPDNSTHILVTYLYELSFRLGRPGQASAVSLVMLAIVFAFAAVYMRLRREAPARKVGTRMGA